MTDPMIQKIAAAMAKEWERADAADQIMRAETRRQGLRSFYKQALPEILEAGAAEWGIDPYEVDWDSLFTPIERALWHDIRAVDIVMYPQYPILGYFVDFANPVAKVCIECDGAQWHTDKEKDARRQQQIQAHGWTVYRISGRDCKTDRNEETGEIGEARSLIVQIAQNHRVRRGW